ncbi:MAG: cytochrome c-type biogenesis protein CcmH [Actinomycetota bacterium]|nr:cytochrome c-type biogenesis protein CcmH [Actinomycetota bacterium]
MRGAGVAISVLVVMASPALGTSPEETAADVSDEIMSPYCPGVTLHDCASEPALKLRERIEDWARSGWSKQRILEHLEDQWGEGILASPKPEGAGLLAWLLPGLAIVLGTGAVVVVARRWAGRPRSNDVPEISSEERKRLEAEMARLREQT